MVLMSGDNLPATSPAMVYLASLAPTGRASMTSSLRTVAQLLGFDDWQAVPWHLLRYEHLQAIRTKLAESYAPATANEKNGVRCLGKRRCVTTIDISRCPMITSAGTFGSPISSTNILRSAPAATQSAFSTYEILAVTPLSAFGCNVTRRGCLDKPKILC